MNGETGDDEEKRGSAKSPIMGECDNAPAGASAAGGGGGGTRTGGPAAAGRRGCEGGVVRRAGARLFGRETAWRGPPTRGHVEDDKHQSNFKNVQCWAPPQFGATAVIETQFKIRLVPFRHQNEETRSGGPPKKKKKTQARRSATRLLHTPTRRAPPTRSGTVAPATPGGPPGRGARLAPPPAPPGQPPPRDPPRA